MRVHIVMSAHTFEYFTYCVTNHMKLADRPDLLEFCAYSLDKQGYDMAELWGAAVFTPINGSSKFKVIRLPDGSGSIGHMIGLNAIFKSCAGDDEINVISDSDCIMLMKGWDSWLRDAVHQGYGALGTTYEDVGGFSSGSGTAQTYKRIPNFSWCALAPRNNWDFDTSSDKQNLFPIMTKEQSEIWNLPIGSQLYREPCWMFPHFLSLNGIKPYPFDFVRPTSSKAKAVLSGEDYHTEYQLHDGTPYVAHQRGSMSKAFRVHHLSKTFYDACEAYIEKNNG